MSGGRGGVGAGAKLTSGGGLARVDMADDDDVDMSLLLTAGGKKMSVPLIKHCSHLCRQKVGLWWMMFHSPHDGRFV